MTVAPDPLRDIQSLPGGQFMAACIDAAEASSYRIRAREESARARGQAVVPENLRDAALLAACAEMLGAVKADGENASAAGHQPPAAIVKAVTAGKRAFQQIDGGTTA